MAAMLDQRRSFDVLNKLFGVESTPAALDATDPFDALANC